MALTDEKMMEVQRLLEKGVGMKVVAAKFGIEVIAEIIEKEISERMSAITDHLIRLLTLPPPLGEAFVKMLEGKLEEDDDLPRFAKWQISMLTGALQDEDAVKSAHEFVDSDDKNI